MFDGYFYLFSFVIGSKKQNSFKWKTQKTMFHIFNINKRLAKRI